MASGRLAWDGYRIPILAMCFQCGLSLDANTKPTVGKILPSFSREGEAQKGKKLPTRCYTQKQVGPGSTLRFLTFTFSQGSRNLKSWLQINFAYLSDTKFESFKTL